MQRRIVFFLLVCVGFCSVGGEGFPIGSSEARGVRRGSVRCDLCSFLFFLFFGSVFGYWLECWRFVESSSLCLFFFRFVLL